MEKGKRKLYPWEKILQVVGVVLCLAALVFFIVSFTSSAIDWLFHVGWICICIGQIIINIIRWEDHRKVNVVFIWIWSILLTGYVVLLVSRLLSS